MSENPESDFASQHRVPPLVRARRRVAALKGLCIHVAIFAVVIFGLFMIDALAGRGWWVQWVLIGWSIGLAAHAVAVYFDASERVARWEDRKVEELLRQDSQPEAARPQATPR